MAGLLAGGVHCVSSSVCDFVRIELEWEERRSRKIRAMERERERESMHGILFGNSR